ncbi:MAG: cell division protein FtsX [Fibrobacterota bacterium]
MNNLLFYITEAIRSLREAKMVTFISIITVAVTLFLLAGISLSLYNLHEWVAQQSAGPVVSVYLQPETEEATADQVYNDIVRMKGVHTAAYSSPRDEYERFVDLWGEEFLAPVDENPFPPAVYIDSLDDDIDIGFLSDMIGDMSGVESVHFAEEWFNELRFIRERLTRYMSIAMVIIATALFFTIVNTVKLTIYARRDLVINMQYLGASRTYIRMPFIIEGVFQGCIGAAAAWGFLVVLQNFVITMEGIEWFEESMPFWLLTTGVFMGVLGSFRAIQRFET